MNPMKQPHELRPIMITLARAISPLSVLVLLATTAPASATATKAFKQAAAKDFEEGEATGSMVLPTGEVVPGMKTTAVEAESSFVWCSALSRDGATAYFGSGDDGKIFAIDAKTNVADKKGEKARV